MWDKDSVKTLRQSLELTQMEFAELLGCRQQTISEWEQGLYAPANAYGKLLAQIKSRAPIVARSQGATAREDFETPVHVERKNDHEFFNEPLYERPFDPAID